MRTHILAGLLASTALLAALAPAASAAPSSATSRIEGEPSITSSSPTGYYLFRGSTDDRLHLRTHGPAAEHDFDAVLSTRGTFEDVDVVKLEDGDRVDVADGGHRLIIHFHTFDFADGVNFSVRGSERLRLDLKLDDKPAPNEQVFLGARGRHPKHNPFTVRV